METTKNPALEVSTNTLIDMKDHALDGMQYLAQAEAILTIIGDSLNDCTPESEKLRLTYMVCKEKIQNVYDLLDTCICYPINRILPND